jgi:hypothetical protein
MIQLQGCRQFYKGNKCYEYVSDNKKTKNRLRSTITLML